MALAKGSKLRSYGYTFDKPRSVGCPVYCNRFKVTTDNKAFLWLYNAFGRTDTTRFNTIYVLNDLNNIIYEGPVYKLLEVSK